MGKKCNYGFGTELSINFDDAISKVGQLLKKHGFNVYTQLNLQDILGDSIQDSLGRYLILGACNPEFAKDLFQVDPDIGMLMPCNIIIYELLDNKCRIMVKDPARIMDLMSHPVAIQAAIKVKEQLEQLVEELETQDF